MSLQNWESLSEQAVEVTCDQLVTFIFAGHDTTGTAIACAFYELSRTPHALKAVRAELDEVFGRDCSPENVADCLTGRGGDQLIQKLPYTSAVLKETLRLWPPGATARMSQPGDGLQLVMEIDGRDRVLDADGIMLHPLQQAIHRDPAVFGNNANAFVPERWLGLGADKIPPGAWRPFERGPRNCIGQELAMIEARVVIAMMARRFDFTKVGIGSLALDVATGTPIMGDHGQYKVTEELYQVSHPTSRFMFKQQVRMTD
jgi:cytochrome P450